jgi:hypothetical protein
MATHKSTAGASDLPAGLSQPALRALQGAGVTSLAQLRRKTEAEVAALHGMGPKGISMLREALRAKGWEFKRGGKEGDKGKKGYKASAGQ